MSSAPRALIVVAAASLATFAATVAGSCSGDSSDAGRAGRGGAVAANAEVDRVVDGDTIVVRSGGDRDRVRLLGIDSPESVKPDTPVECYGKEASAHLAELLPAGTPVRLERDVEPRDRYGRLLAYVYRASDGDFVNLDQVTGGYAQAAFIKPNVARRPQIQAASDTARRNRTGLWGACGGDDLYG